SIVLQSMSSLRATGVFAAVLANQVLAFEGNVTAVTIAAEFMTLPLTDLTLGVQALRTGQNVAGSRFNLPGRTITSRSIQELWDAVDPPRESTVDSLTLLQT